MASQVKKIWEKRASNVNVDNLMKTQSLDSARRLDRKTLDVVNKFEAMVSSESAAKDLAKISSSYRPFANDETTANTENELRHKKSLQEIAKDTTMNRDGNGRVVNSSDNSQIRQQIGDVKKSLQMALAVLDAISP